MSHSARTLDHRQHDVLVIGAGQAGVALGHHLAGRGADFLLLDAAPEIGHSWRSRWDSLRLFTPAQYDSLPGMPFPAPADSHPGKDDVANYLAAYAARFELPVRLGSPVLGLYREPDVPRTLSTVSGVTAVVTGSTAGSVAFQDLLHQRTPWVFAFVLVLAFALLLVSFRSVVVAATAIVLNLLSVAAAYGTLVLVFQHGWGKSLIGLDSTGPIVNWVPLFLFVILFGLSMDYHVFILSRIREGFDRGCSTWDAIASGVTSSAGVITSAAIIMVFVFATFVTLSTTNMKQIGLGLAVAVLLDATVVRALLLPAVMQLLDDRNWYLPLWLRWLPAVQQEGDPVALLTPQSWLPVGAGPADTAPGRGEHQENNWPSAVVSRDLVDGPRGSPVLDVMTTLPPNRRTEQSA